MVDPVILDLRVSNGYGIHATPSKAEEATELRVPRQLI